MSEKIAIHTLDGTVFNGIDTPFGVVNKGMTEESVIAQAAKAGWILNNVTKQDGERSLEFKFAKVHQEIDVLIGKFQGGALAQLWTTLSDSYRAGYVGFRDFEASDILAQAGWRLIASLGGRNYYVRSCEKVKSASPLANNTEMYF